MRNIKRINSVRCHPQRNSCPFPIFCVCILSGLNLIERLDCWKKIIKQGHCYSDGLSECNGDIRRSMGCSKCWCSSGKLSFVNLWTNVHFPFRVEMNQNHSPIHIRLPNRAKRAWLEWYSFALISECRLLKKFLLLLSFVFALAQEWESRLWIRLKR